MDRAIKSLAGHGVITEREAWLKEAQTAEKGGSLAVCSALVRSTIGAGVEEEDRKRTWTADADECARAGTPHTARTIYEVTLAAFPGDEDVWVAAAQLEKQAGTRESLDALLRRAVTYCPQAVVLWLMGAKVLLLLSPPPCLAVFRSLALCSLAHFLL